MRFPDQCCRVYELCEFAALSDSVRKMVSSLGIETVRCGGDNYNDDLAIQAAMAALQKVNLDPREIDAFILVGGRAPSYLLVSEATRVQAAIGAQRAFTFSITDLGCVSISAALVVSRALLEANSGWNNILIVNESRPATSQRFRYPVTVIGDGAMGVLVSRVSSSELVDIEIRSDGTYWDLFRVRFRDRPYSDWTEECADPRAYSFQLAIESRNQFATLIESQLARHHFTLNQINHVIMQNVSLGAYRFYEEAFGLTFSPVCAENLCRYGHLGSIDVILNLSRGIETGLFRPGELVLALNNSPVAAWSTMLVRM